MASATTCGVSRRWGIGPAFLAPLWPMILAQAVPAASARSRMTIGKLIVRSMLAGSRPTAAQCSASVLTLRATSSSGPLVFHPSAWRATVRSVLRGPLPPTRIGSLGWTGRGSQTASVSR